MIGIKKRLDIIIISSSHLFFTILADEYPQIPAKRWFLRLILKHLLQDRFPAPLEQIIFYLFQVWSGNGGRRRYGIVRNSEEGYIWASFATGQFESNWTNVCNFHLFFRWAHTSLQFLHKVFLWVAFHQITKHFQG